MSTDSSLLTFPCELPIKVLGRNEAAFRDAAIVLHDRDVARREQVLAIRTHPEREDRRMLDEPDLVRRVRVARGREGLHLGPNLGQGPEAELAELGSRRVGGHSTIRICGAATSCL